MQRWNGSMHFVSSNSYKLINIYIYAYIVPKLDGFGCFRNLIFVILFSTFVNYIIGWSIGVGYGGGGGGVQFNNIV